MTEPTPPPVRTFVESAVILKMLDISRPTLDKLIEFEGLPCVRLANRLYRFDIDAVNRWIDSRWSTRNPDEVDAA
jgi:excisionase family DNA binding protein